MQFIANPLSAAFTAGSLSVIAVMILLQTERVRRKDGIRLIPIEWRWILMEFSIVAASVIEAEGAYVLAMAHTNVPISDVTLVLLSLPVLLGAVYLVAGLRIGRMRPIVAACTLLTATIIVLIASLQHGRFDLSAELAAAWAMLTMSSVVLLSTRFRFMQR